jgi:L-asparaginase II
MDPQQNGYPENPVVVRVRRAGVVESLHRGAWCLVDGSGSVLAGAGDYDEAFFVRSSIKAIQALPLLETGAADRFSFAEHELALALSSHSGEACHTEGVAATLARLGLGEADLRCGTHPPTDPAVRRDLVRAYAKPTQLHNNCSGKHAGFLALARHLGVPTERYLDPEGEGQTLVREALAQLTETPPESLVAGKDGCSAPTYRLSLVGLATGFARITTPDGLAVERREHLLRLTSAAAANPVLVAGSHRRIDTDVLAATGGRLFPKIGAEAVHALGVVGGDRGLALKIDDGGLRGLHTLLLGLLRALGLATEAELEALAAWDDPVLRNHAGLEIGRIEAVVS